MATINTKHFVYAPKVEAYIYTSGSDEKMYDISDDIVSGSVARKIDAVSTAQISLANSNYKYDNKFSPMDRIVIYLTKKERIKVFTGYVTEVPLFSAEATVTIKCECVLGRLQRLYWDSGLQASIDEYFDVEKGIGFQPVGGVSKYKDGGMSLAIQNVLSNVADIPLDKISITDLPQDIIDYATTMYALTNEEDEAFKNGMVSLFMNGNQGSFAVSNLEGSDISSIPTEYRGKIKELSAKHEVPVWLIATMCDAESSWNNKAMGGNARGLCQFEFMPSRAKVTTPPLYKEGRGNYFHNNNWHDGLWSLEVGVDYLSACYKQAKKNLPAKDATDPMRVGELSYWYYSAGLNKKGKMNINAPNMKNFINKAKKYIVSGGHETYGDVGVAHRSNTLLDKVVKIANQEVGTKEKYPPKNSNRTKYSEAYGLIDMWCMMFCWWVFREAGAEDLVPKTASTREAANYFKRKSAWYQTPEVGDLAFFPRATKDIGHVGIVVETHTDGSYVIVEGNASDMVKKSKIKKGRATGFGRPAFSEGQTQSSQLSPEDRGRMFNTDIWYIASKFYHGSDNPASLLLKGVRSYANDTSVYSKIQELCKTGLRSFSSSPDGGFWAWYPDKFGVSYGISPSVEIPSMEVVRINTTMSDTSMATHTYVYGSHIDDFLDNYQNEYDKINFSNGVATIDNEFSKSYTGDAKSARGFRIGGNNDEVSSLLSLIINIPKGKEKDFSPNAIYKRYGVRPKKLPALNGVSNLSFMPYMRALFELIQSWQDMYSCSAEVTFLPEVFAGQRVDFIDEDIQFYVDSVTHSFDYSRGFRTVLGLSCPTSKTRDMFIKDGAGVSQ